MMKKQIWFVIVFCGVFLCGAGYQAPTVPDIELAQKALFRGFDELERLDAFVVGSGGVNLGKISRSGSDALGNQFGPGSQFQSDGLFNKFSKFGDKFSDTSAFNALASKPPKIVLESGGKLYSVGSLTTNKISSGSGQQINPYLLQAWLNSK